MKEVQSILDILQDDGGTVLFRVLVDGVSRIMRTAVQEVLDNLAKGTEEYEPLGYPIYK